MPKMSTVKNFTSYISLFGNLSLLFNSFGLCKKLTLLPFGLFTSQIPYIILGVMYVLYLGMAFVTRTGKEENQTIALQQNDSTTIEFVTGSSDANLPVIVIVQHNDIRPGKIFGHIKCIVRETYFTFPELVSCGSYPASLNSHFQINCVSFSGFSRPPPVTA
jgi:hypothetical protein